jgi:solute carrier family 25 protein 16
MVTPASPSIDLKGKGRATGEADPDSFDEHHWRPARESERWTAASIWRESRRRAQADRESWDYSALVYLTRHATS